MKKYSMMFLIDFQGRKSFLISIKSLTYFWMASSNKLKQVYVPAYTRKTLRVTGPNAEVMILGKDCDAYLDMTRYNRA
jgi:hypothetical protein